MILLLLAGVSAAAKPTIDISPGISVSRKNGCLKIGSLLTTDFYCAAPKWKSIARQSWHFTAAGGAPVETEGEIAFRGNLRTNSGDFVFEERLRKTSATSLSCTWQIENDSGIESEMVYFFVSLPAKVYTGVKVSLDGRLHDLSSETIVTPFRNISRIEVPCPEGIMVLSGKLSGQIRFESGKSYNIKLWGTPLKGLIKKSRVTFKLAVEKVASQPIDIRRAANTSFTDEVDGDRQGGWTDQGQRKDLRSLKPGLKNLGGIEFNILDADGNNGKSCIVLRGQERSYLPRETTIFLSGQKYRQLYLLHTAAWCTSGSERRKEPVGKIKVVYQDGDSEEISVVSGVDVQDWTSGIKRKNAIPVWKGKSETFSHVILNISSFPLQFKELQSLSLISADNRPVWMVAGVSGGAGQVAPLQDDGTRTIVYKPDDTWKAIDWVPLTCVKGSALDLSETVAAPVGKYGEIYWQGDNFFFKGRPGKAIRFQGVNLTHALPFIDKAQAEQLADYFAAVGYNTVRFHIYYGWLVEGGTPKLKAAPLDRFCYLMYCLGQRGIYYSVELWGATSTSHQIIHDPSIPEYSDQKISRSTLMGLVPISTPAMTYVKSFARNLLLHANPYTGTLIKDDPALFSVEMLNENSIYFIFKAHRNKTDSHVIKIWKRKCAQYLSRRHGKEVASREVDQFLPEFMLLKQNESTAELISFLREIGLKKPITGLGFEPRSIATELTRQKLDYVDNHAYTQIAEGLPAHLTNSNPTAEKWQAQLQGGAARLFGKPFAMGEYNMSYPTPHWSFMIPAEATIAGIQNWSRTCFFNLQALPKWVFKPYPSSGVQSSNPMTFIANLIGSKLFREGEVLPSKVKIPYVVTPDYILSKLDTKGAPYYPSEYSILGLCCQIGTVIYQEKTDLSQYPCVVVPLDMEIPATMRAAKYFRADMQLHANLKTFLPGLSQSRFESTTGQTILDSSQKTFSIVTPQAECFMLPKETPEIQGDRVGISGNQTISTSFIGSLDQQPIKTSRRLLALYMTDIKNTGTVLKYGLSGVEYLKQGTVPFLLRQASVTFSLKTLNPTLPKIWALKYDGSREIELTPHKTDEGVRFTVKAVSAKNAYFCYEIVWE
jgi:hypothetical protein